MFESPQLNSLTKWHHAGLGSSGCVLMYDNRSIVCLFLRTFYFLHSHWRDNDRPDEHSHSFNFLLFSSHFYANEEIESSVFCFAMFFAHSVPSAVYQLAQVRCKQTRFRRCDEKRNYVYGARERRMGSIWRLWTTARCMRRLHFVWRQPAVGFHCDDVLIKCAVDSNCERRK